MVAWAEETDFLYFHLYLLDHNSIVFITVV